MTLRLDSDLAEPITPTQPPQEKLHPPAQADGPLVSDNAGEGPDSQSSWPYLHTVPSQVSGLALPNGQAQGTSTSLPTPNNAL